MVVDVGVEDGTAAEGTEEHAWASISVHRLVLIMDIIRIHIMGHPIIHQHPFIILRRNLCLWFTLSGMTLRSLKYKKSQEIHHKILKNQLRDHGGITVLILNPIILMSINVQEVG